MGEEYFLPTFCWNKKCTVGLDKFTKAVTFDWKVMWKSSDQKWLQFSIFGRNVPRRCPVVTGGVEKSSYVTSVSPGHIHYQHSLKINLIPTFKTADCINKSKKVLFIYLIFLNTKFMSAWVHKAVVSNDSCLMKKIVVKQILKIKQIK